MSSRVLVRVLMAVLLGLLSGVGVAVTAVLAQGGTTVAVPVEVPAAVRKGAEPGAPPATSRAREVLRAWDEARAEAWTDGDTAALRGLYVPGSVAGARDVAMLEEWNDRGRRVTGLTTQLLRLQVLEAGERRLVLVVTDRLARVEAGADLLPRDRASTTRVELRRRGGSWRAASVSPQPTPS